MSKVSIQSFLQNHANDFLTKHSLPLFQHKALWSLQHCRTSAMGSHADVCEHGHVENVYYNSCRHRSCPQCQYLKTEHWLRRQQARLLDTQHHHWVFTIPHSLLPLWRFHQQKVQDILFKSVQLVLKQLASDTKYLNAQPGMFLALHTWGRNLSLHPHIHCLITHGGLNEQGQWVVPKQKCMFPAKVMMQLFRGKFLAQLKDAFSASELPTNQQLYASDWVVHCCKPYDHGDGVAKYLARYMRGGAIRNGQLIQADDQVVFRYKSHRTGKKETLRLSSTDFIKRLLQHVMIPSKQTMRCYGLYHPSNIKTLNKARAHFKQSMVRPMEAFDWQAWLGTKLKRSNQCSQCQGVYRQKNEQI